jgi:hypothetical protein
VVKVAREHGETRSQANLFFASERSRSLCRFARRRGKPPFRVGESASERRLVSLMCEGLVSVVFSCPRELTMSRHALLPPEVILALQDHVQTLSSVSGCC